MNTEADGPSMIRCGDEVFARLLASQIEIDEAQALFERVSLEMEWRREPASPSAVAPYVFASYVGDRIAGAIEVRPPGASGRLPILDTWPELRLDRFDRHAELVLLAVAPDFRGSTACLWALCVEMWRHCRNIGLQTLLMEVPPRNVRIYRRLGWPLEVIGPDRLHWGEPCFPCSLCLDAVAASVLEKADRLPELRFIRKQALRESEGEGFTVLPQSL